MSLIRLMSAALLTAGTSPPIPRGPRKLLQLLAPDDEANFVRIRLQDLGHEGCFAIIDVDMQCFLCADRFQAMHL